MRNSFWFPFTFCLVLLLHSTAFAQEIQPKGRFLADSVRIGEPVMYSFSVRYPRQLNVLLPDSTFNFAPFEIIDKTYYPTRTDSLFSTDSVIYTLSTFELDSIQQLRLPAYLLLGRDSSVVFSEPDRIRVLEMIPVLTDSAAFVENTAYKEVEKEFNYPYVIAGTVVALAILIALAFIFGKPFQRQYRIYKLKRQYKKYEKEYQQALAAYESREESMQPEALLGIWKGYMEQLEQIPYTKLTTKEIASRQVNGTDLNRILRPIDRGIYGRLSDNRMIQSFQELHTVANHSFKKKVKEVRNA